MKYIRFQGLAPNPGMASKTGIFQLAYKLKYSSETSRRDDRELRRHLDWLETHLDAPNILDRAEHYRSICWFKDCVNEPLQRIWAIKSLLEEYGFWVDRITTATPGLIIYEDEWQVVAKPFRKRTRL